MRRLVLLHTNDIHGRIEGLARVATLVASIRAEEDADVLYLDAGDIEETTVRVSNLTKGVAMHTILTAAGCDVATVGNGAWLRYGMQVITEQADTAGYPLLLANLAPVEGVQPSVLLRAGDWQIGVIGITDPFLRLLGGFDFGIESLEPLPLVRELARELRTRGAELVVLLSHVGYENEFLGYDDRTLARDLAGDVDLVIGAHSHTLLPEGERVGDVLVTQAGSYAEHLGRIDVAEDGVTASVLPVPADTPLHAGVLAAAAAAERELREHLDEVIAVLDVSLDSSFVAEVYRERMGAEIGLATELVTLDAPLPAGTIRRGELWEVCHSSGNPGVVELTGAQLLAMIERAADPEFQASTAGSLRGKPRGRLFVAGPPEIEPGETYRVAASDWELEAYGGMVDPAWDLKPVYDFPTIVREAVEDSLARRRAAPRGSARTSAR